MRKHPPYSTRAECTILHVLKAQYVPGRRATPPRLAAERQSKQAEDIRETSHPQQYCSTR